jgi:hypothetical protein
VILVSNRPRQPLVDQANAGSGVDFLIGPFNAVGLPRAIEQILAPGFEGDPKETLARFGSKDGLEKKIW